MEMKENKNYLIYNDGKVFSQKAGRFLKPILMNNGYYYVMINRKMYLIHRLVLEHFHINPDSKPCCNHKDGNKLNNNYDNLEWCTYSENIIHALTNGLNKNKGETHYLCKINKNIADKIKVEYAKGDKTQKQIGITFGLSRSHISSILNGRYWND
jgi:hypothetical protein